MTHVEKLFLSLRVGRKNSFIDGAYLYNNIHSQMPHLDTFHFDIVTDHVLINEQQPKVTSNHIRRTFMERGYHVDCYTDYRVFGTGRCHVYSVPSQMERICPITRSFSDGMLNNVRALRMKDYFHSFEHKLFIQISHSFPSLSRLMVSNTNKQEEKHEEKSSIIIRFPRLIELEYSGVHIDYVEQFLSDLNTCLPCLKKIHISYKQLANVTENFTRNMTRMNCAKLKHIIFDQNIEMAHTKDYYLYFPSLL